MRAIDPAERRARLARRHRLLPGDRAPDVVAAADSIVCLHATDPATVYLSAWARVDDLARDDVDRALYVDRTLVKQLAMRRTLFAFPRGTLAAALAGAGARVAELERRRLIRDVEAAGLHRDGARWLETASAAVLDALADGRLATASELRAELPVLEGTIMYGEGRSWGGRVPVAPRVLTTLSAAGRIVRATNDGAWTASRPRWALTSAWLGEEVPPLPPADGERELVRGWLRAFGPGTAADLRWWLGSTVRAVRRALSELDAVEVDLDGQVGYVLPDDVEPVAPVAPWAALLPPLDPTTMGWFERDWYLGPHRPQLFDSNGNAGATVWWDGRIVGGWRQDDDGTVVVRLLEDVGADAVAAVEREAERLTDWFEGTRVLPRFPAPMWKQDAPRRR